MCSGNITYPNTYLKQLQFSFHKHGVFLTTCMPAIRGRFCTCVWPVLIKLTVKTCLCQVFENRNCKPLRYSNSIRYSTPRNFYLYVTQQDGQSSQNYCCFLLWIFGMSASVYVFSMGNIKMTWFCPQKNCVFRSLYSFAFLPSTYTFSPHSAWIFGEHLLRVTLRLRDVFGVFKVVKQSDVFFMKNIPLFRHVKPAQTEVQDNASLCLMRVWFIDRVDN